jgi:glutamine---fructose-6-phosphate transaminase (isomerizing)
MCGIVGYIGAKDCVPILMEGLARVEYRGYDSTGIAVVKPKSGVEVFKKKGKLRELELALPKKLIAHLGIGHTRWATHGEPSDTNAHPHLSDDRTVAVVHNGIIENFSELKTKLEADGVSFASETDTETLAHLIGRRRAQGEDLQDAVRHTLSEVEGTYGLVAIDSTQPDRMVVARNGSPVILGVGEKEMLVASDVTALVRHTKQVIPLDDGEMAVLTPQGYRTFALDATPTQKRVLDVTWNIEQLDKGGYEHFLRKEIDEQPAAVERALKGRLDERFNTARLGGITMSSRELISIRRVKFLGCGSALYAGMAGAQMIENMARIPTDAESASEFRYRNPVIEPDVLYVAVSQSGETADTLGAVMEIKRKGGQVIAVVNVVGSTIARECSGVYMHAGPEVSVASTKVFTSMLVSFALLGLHLGRVRDLSPAEGHRVVEGLKALPDTIRRAIGLEPQIKAIAEKYKDATSMFFIGRNTGHPIALEGAQKLKEISYIHAEAYAASELKHGPIALVSETFPTVVVLPDDELFEKNVSSIQQVRARKGPVIAVTQRPLAERLADDVLMVPRVIKELDPIVLNIPLQLLAYHSACALGRDVDQPRNLAKSVTVE